MKRKHDGERDAGQRGGQVTHVMVTKEDMGTELPSRASTWNMYCSRVSKSSVCRRVMTPLTWSTENVVDLVPLAKE